MKRISGFCVYSMTKDNEPVLRAQSGETVVFETKDCFGNQVTSEEEGVELLDWDNINPATGPLYIEGAEPGDALKITILDIQTAEYGTMAAIPQGGVLGKLVEKSQVKRLLVKDGLVYFNENIKLPAAPMIGVIGVAPAQGIIPCGEPGSHGGNMDNTKIKKGAVLYLPVFHTGALLAMGDVHACMGDGEIMVTGVEIPAEVTVRVDVIKNLTLSNPLLEDETDVYTIASDADLERAIFEATLAMNSIVMRAHQLNFNEAGMLLSAAGNLEFCQVVDPKRTVRLRLPKTLLPSLF